MMESASSVDPKQFSLLDFHFSLHFWVRLLSKTDPKVGDFNVSSSFMLKDCTKDGPITTSLYSPDKASHRSLTPFPILEPSASYQWINNFWVGSHKDHLPGWIFFRVSCAFFPDLSCLGYVSVLGSGSQGAFLAIYECG